MESNKTNLAVREVINNHAFILNKAAVDQLYTCYSNDAIFTPDGHKKLYYSDIVKLKSGRSLKNSQFEISYEFEELDIDNNYAFVNAVAITKTKVKNTVTSKKSSDFFVLKLVATEWKIYRHTFNNVPEKKNQFNNY